MNKTQTRQVYVALVLGALTLCTTLVNIVRNYSPIPYEDQWDGTIGFYMRAAANPLAAFFEQHNEHRLFVSRLLFFTDVRYFGARNMLDLAGSVVLAALIALLLYRIVIRHLKSRPEIHPAVAGIVLVFVFSWMQSDNFTWGFQSQWFAVYLFALGAFHALELSHEASQSSRPSRSNWWLATTVASAFLAAGSMVSGVLVLPVLVVQATYLRLGKLKIAFLILCTLGLWAIYFANWREPGGAGSLSLSPQRQLVGLVEYVLLYLGSPAYHVGLSQPLTPLCGALIVLAIAYGLLMVMRRRSRIAAVSLFAMTVFIGGNAVVTAIGRLSLGIDSAMTLRYSTAALLLLFSILFFLWLNDRNPGRHKRIAWFIMLSTVAVWSYQRVAFHSPYERSYRKMLAGLALRSHVYDAAFTEAIYPFPDRLRILASQAEQMRLSIFASRQTDYKIPPSTVEANGQCQGEIEGITRTETPGVFAARGWIFDPSTRQYAKSIVFADTTGVVIGTGLTGEERRDLKSLTHSTNRYGGWNGFFTKPRSGEVRVFGEIGEGRYCGLPTGKSVPQ